MRKLAPKLVLRSWTEDPELSATADGPDGRPWPARRWRRRSGAAGRDARRESRASARYAALISQAQEHVAPPDASSSGSTTTSAPRPQDQLKNADAVALLDELSRDGRGRYLYAGMDAGIAERDPGARGDGARTADGRAGPARGQAARERPGVLADGAGCLAARGGLGAPRRRRAAPRRAAARTGPLAGRAARRPAVALRRAAGARPRRRAQQHEPHPAPRGRRAVAAVPRRRADRELAAHARRSCADDAEAPRRGWRGSTSTRSATTAAATRLRGRCTPCGRAAPDDLPPLTALLSTRQDVHGERDNGRAAAAAASRRCATSPTCTRPTSRRPAARSSSSWSPSAERRPVPPGRPAA